MAKRTTYNAKDCTVLVGNVYITGLGEDMVSFEKDEDLIEPRVGAQGDVCVNQVNNSLYTLTLRVQATCPQKKHLFSLANSGKIFPVWVTNKSIGERFGGTSAAVRNLPELTHGAVAEDREFVITVFDGVVESV